MEFKKRDIFKLRKSKVYKNLVSYGQYGVVVATAVLSMGATTIAAEENPESLPPTEVENVASSEVYIETVPTSQVEEAIAPAVETAIPTATENVADTEATATESTTTEATVAPETTEPPAPNEAPLKNEEVVKESSSLSEVDGKETEAIKPTTTTTTQSEEETAKPVSTPSIEESKTPTSTQSTETAVAPTSTRPSEELATATTTPSVEKTEMPIDEKTAESLNEIPMMRSLLTARTTGDVMSPNTSGTVIGSLTTTSPTTDNRLTGTISQTVMLDISGDEANYNGGYIEVKITNGSALNVLPSALSGVTTRVTLDGPVRTIKYTFSPTGLDGGAYYNLLFNYNFRATTNWNNVIDSINDDNFTITTTAKFYDKDGLLVKDLGTLTHQYKELQNGVGGGTAMSRDQVVGYDLNKDGIIDENGKISFFIYTGVLNPETNITGNDYFSPGTGVFDGRLVNGFGNTGAVGAYGIDAVSTYTYDIPLIKGVTLSQASRDLGWTEDDTGYHLTATRETNPLPGDDTFNAGNSSNRVPIIFDIIQGASVSEIVNNKSISVTGTYTKLNGDTYSNSRNIPYTVKVPTLHPTQGVAALDHRFYGADSEIIASYGRAYYNTTIGLNEFALADELYPLDDYTLKITTDNDNEFFRQLDIESRYLEYPFAAGGTLRIYNDATGELLQEVSQNTFPNRRHTLSINEADRVKSLRLTFNKWALEKSSSKNVQASGFGILESTFFADWETIYNDETITKLPSKTTAQLVKEGEGVKGTRSATTLLERLVYTIELNERTDVLFNTTSGGAGFVQTYTLTNTASTRPPLAQNELQIAAQVGKLYQAHLISPELKLGNPEWFNIYYNYNNTGKDLYVEKEPVTSTRDPIGQNVVGMANSFIPNGTYDVMTIGYWEGINPNLIATDGIDFGTINGIAITAQNSATRNFKVRLTASESSGVLSRVKADKETEYTFNTTQHEAQDIIDFKVSYTNVSKSSLSNISVITSLPRNNDKQLDPIGKSRRSQFSVYLTEPVTPPAGWSVVYTTTPGTAAEMEAKPWLTANKVTDWSEITAVKFVSQVPVTAGSKVDFYINNARIGGDALQGEKAYLSSASSVGAVAYIESNNVLIEMATTIPDGTVKIYYQNEAGETIAVEKTIANDIKSNYDVSNKNVYYPEYLTGIDGLPYVYVRTTENSAKNTGLFAETVQEITHIYQLVPQTALIKYVNVTNPANPVQLDAVDSVTGPSNQEIVYTTQTRIDQYLSAGYMFVESDFVNTPRYDTDRLVNQQFTVSLKERIEEVPVGTIPGKPVNPTDPNSPTWPESVRDLEVNKTVTRTIEYRYLTADGTIAATQQVQEVAFTRRAFVNLVTGALEFGEWTAVDAEMPAVNSPAIQGYTPDKVTVPAIQVTGNTASSTEIVIYRPDAQVARVTYVDETTGAELVIDGVSGVTDAPINYSTANRIAEYEAQGYELVTDGYPKDAVYDKDGTVDQEYTVTLRHKIVPVTPANPTNPKDNTPLELTRTVTRTVEYKYLTPTGAQASETVTQTVTFQRNATVDMVTGAVVYAEWTTDNAEMPAVDSPTIQGYTVDKTVVPVLTVTEDTPSSTEVVVYKPDAQVARVTYIDETTGNELVIDGVSGVTDAPINYSTANRIAEYEALGYELVTDGYPKDAIYDKDGTVDQEYTVTLRHKIVPVTPENPTNPKDNTPLELTRTVTRTVEYKYLTSTGTEASATVTQTVTFQRNATVDMVTGAVVYANWTTDDAEMPAVDSPAIPGYTADKTTIPVLTVTEDTPSSTEVVVYTPDAQAATVTYIDETTGVELDVDTLNGVTDAPINYSTADRIAAYEALGYELVTDGYPTDAVYDKDGAVEQAFTVTLKHKIVPVTPENPTNPKDNTPLELTRTVTRTVEYKYLTPTGEEASGTVTQTVTFQRNATVDMVTGAVVYANWTTDDAEMPAVDSPAIPGYTADKVSVPVLEVTAETPSATEVVIYTPDTQAATVTYIDETTGVELVVDTLNGVTDDPMNYSTANRIAEYEALGYELVTDGYPADAVYDKDGAVDQEYTVTLRHKIVPVTPENPTNPKDNTPLELTRSVTRTVEYKYLTPTGEEASGTVTQTVTFQRNATVDMVTGAVVYANWTTDNAEMPAVDSPAIPGYTADKVSIPVLEVTAETPSSTEVVVYTPDAQVARVTYIDETTGVELVVDTLNGVTDDPMNYSTANRIAEYEAQGYELVTDGYPTDAVYDKDGAVDQAFTVTLKHKIVPVTPENPTNPKDNTPLELTRTVTRTVEYKYLTPTGTEASATVTQTVTFQRNATVDMVTGAVVYANWTTDDAEMPAVDSPAIPGYTADKVSIPVLEVTAETPSATEVVVYTPDAQVAKITYVDETTGVELVVDTLNGVTDDPMNYSTANRIAEYEALGYELVTDGYPTDAIYDKDGNVDQTFTVTLKHKIVPVTPENPTNPKDNTPLELTRTVTRTVEYKYLTPTGTEAATTVTQTVTFQRNATVDMVTGAVVYANWTTDDAEMPAVDSPAIPGYTADKVSIPVLEVTAETPSSTEVVVYTPDAQVVRVYYVDETTGAELVIDGMGGVTDAPVNYSTANRIAEYEAQGYELVTDGYPADAVYDKDGAVDQEYTVTLRHKIVPVTPANPTNPKDNTPLELTRSVTRTVEYKYLTPTGTEASATVTQTVTFQRSATVDMVTGAVVYANWTTDDAEMPAVDSPAIPGYTADKVSIPVLEVTAETPSSTEVVVYTPDAQVARVTYVDETTGVELAVDTLNGVTDDPINYSTADRIAAYEAQGYELVTDGYPTDAIYDKDGNVDQAFTVTLKHKLVPVTPENPTNPKDNTPLELTRTVTRTVEYKYLTPTGTEAATTVTQTVTFQRNATVDMVTGAVVYANWTTDDAEMPAVDSPAIPGYTADKVTVPEVTITEDTPSSTEVVIYTPDAQVARVTYVDETTGAELVVDTLNGVTDDPMNYSTANRIAEYEAQGYELVTDGYPTDAIYDKDGNVDQAFTVTLKHKIVPVTPANPTNPKDNTPLELTRSVTRTVEYKYLTPTGEEASGTVTQTVTFQRNATVDMVTGAVVYANWTTDNAEMPAVDSPAIPGYTADKVTVPEVTITEDTPSSTEVVIYTPDTQVATVTYVDETAGVELAVDTLNGVTDEPINYSTADRIAAYEAQGYELVTDGYPTDAVYDKDGAVDQAFTVTLKHKIVPVTPENPTNPKDNTPLELTRTVTRTVEYKYLTPTGEEASGTVTQTVTFQRSATVDMVTGAVVYANWTTDNSEMPAVDSPAIPGYTADKVTVPEVTITEDTPSSTEVVVYTPDAQVARVTYVDETTGAELVVDTLNGVTDDPMNYSTANRIAEYEAQGYELVTDVYPTDAIYDKDGNVDQAFTVTLKHKIVPVTPANPTNPKDNTPLELTRTVTRTVEYKYLTPTGEEASGTVTQTVTF